MTATRTTSVLLWGARVPPHKEEDIMRLRHSWEKAFVSAVSRRSCQHFTLGNGSTYLGVHVGDVHPDSIGDAYPKGDFLLPLAEVVVPFARAKLLYRSWELLLAAENVCIPPPSLLTLDVIIVEGVLKRGTPLPADFAHSLFTRVVSVSDGLKFFACYIQPGDFERAAINLQTACRRGMICGYSLGEGVQDRIALTNLNVTPKE